MSYKIGIFDFTSNSEIDFIHSQINGMIDALVKKYPDTDRSAYNFELVRIRPSNSMSKLDAAVNFASDKEAEIFARRRNIVPSKLIKRRWEMDNVLSINIEVGMSQRLAIADFLVNDLVKPDPSGHVDIVRDFVSNKDLSRLAETICSQKRWARRPVDNQLSSELYNGGAYGPATNA